MINTLHCHYRMYISYYPNQKQSLSLKMYIFRALIFLCKIQHQFVEQRFYLLINVATCFGLNLWQTSGSFLEHVELMSELLC